MRIRNKTTCYRQRKQTSNAIFCRNINANKSLVSKNNCHSTNAILAARANWFFVKFDEYALFHQYNIIACIYWTESESNGIRSSWKWVIKSSRWSVHRKYSAWQWWRLVIDLHRRSASIFPSNRSTSLTGGSHPDSRVMYQFLSRLSRTSALVLHGTQSASVWLARPAIVCWCVFGCGEKFYPCRKFVFTGSGIKRDVHGAQLERNCLTLIAHFCRLG